MPPSRKRHKPTIVEPAKPPRRRFETIVVATLATIYVLTLTVPWEPLRSITIWHFDYSWMLVLHDAIATGRQFGPELIVPYGPLGFLATNIYDPRTYLILIAVRILLSLAILRVLWETGRKFLPGPVAALPWLMAIIAMMGPGITTHDATTAPLNPRTLGGSEDHFFSICAVVLLIAYFAAYERVASRSVLAMVMVLAVASLAKVNFLLQDIIVIGAITLDQLIVRNRRSGAPAPSPGTPGEGWGGGLRTLPRKDPHPNPFPAYREREQESHFHRRWWLVPAVYVGCLTLFYLLARQSPASLGSFFWGWAQVSVGHIDAVGLPSALPDVIAYLIVAALVLVMVARVESRQHVRSAIVPVLAMAALFALLYKHAFGRQDFAHATIAPMVTLAAAIIYLPIAWPLSGGRMHQAFCIATLTLAGILVSSNLTEYTDQGLGGYAWETIQRSADAFVAVANNLTTPSRLHQQWEADRSAVRAEVPLPLSAIYGPTDVYPHRQDVLFAYSLQYDPRPAFSSLFATAPALAELNARHLHGPVAPETILFDIEPIDEQFPALADGRSWPELLARYDLPAVSAIEPADRSGGMLVLRRSATPRTYHLTPMVILNGRLNEPVAIPESPSALLWARIHLKRRLAGQVMSALYKPPLIQIEVKTRDKSEKQYRLLPGLAEQGFLLSPVVGTRGDFAELMRPSWRTELSPNVVQTITISVVDGSAELNYDSQYTVDLDRLEFSQ